MALAFRAMSELNGRGVHSAQQWSVVDTMTKRRDLRHMRRTILRCVSRGVPMLFQQLLQDFRGGSGFFMASLPLVYVRSLFFYRNTLVCEVVVEYGLLWVRSYAATDWTVGHPWPLAESVRWSHAYSETIAA